MRLPNRYTYSGLFIISCSLLISEILFTRIFSVCLWYHFAFFAISTAMFGIGLGGIFVQLFPALLDEQHLHRRLFFCGIILALTALAMPGILFQFRFSPELFSIFSWKTTLFLAMVFIISSLPFFCAGVMSSLLFTAYSGHISNLYFVDLFGASTGCLLALIFLELFGAANLVIVNSILVCVGALCLLWAGSNKITSKSFGILVVVLALLFIMLLINIATGVFDVRYAKGRDRGIIDEFSRWNSISRVAVSITQHEDDTRWIAERIWGVSRNFKGGYPEVKLITIDADAGTFLTKFDGDFSSVDYVRYDPPSIVHRLKTQAKTLIIGAGGGKDVLSALSFGAKEVTAVELNPIIVNDVMLGRYKSFSGNLYLHPKVKAFAEEGRNFVALSKDKYDIIQLAYVDTSAATSAGAYILAENNLYTVESFKQFLNHLQDGGIFSVCWVDVPGLAGASRLVSLGVAALQELGIKEVSNNIMVVSHAAKRGWIIRNIFLKMAPFTQEEQKVVLSVCKDLDFDPTHIPMYARKGIGIEDIKKYEDFLRVFINYDKNREVLYSIHPHNIRPTTDDSPFFFYQNTFGQFIQSLKLKRAPSFIIYTSGGLVLLRVFLIGIIMVVFFYAIPTLISLWNKKVMPYRKSSALPFLCYFSSIGMGFMLLEIVFLQKLMLFLGHPSYTLSVTLSSVLLFSGLGSMFTQRLKKHIPQVYIGRAIAALLLMGICYLLFLQKILHLFMEYPKLFRIPFAMLILMPISFLMGMPLPLAVKIMHQHFSKIIPWSWAVNAASSVLASIIAIILAMHLGYNFTLQVGLLFYGGVFLINKFLFKPNVLGYKPEAEFSG